MLQINTELGLPKPTKDAGAGNQEPLTPLSVAKVLAHVFLLTSVVFLEMLHVTLFTYPFKYICFLLTCWLNCSYCFHLFQQKWLTCGDTAAFLLMSPDCKLRAGYQKNSICCPCFCLSLFLNPWLLLGQLVFRVLSGAVCWERMFRALKVLIKG